MIQSLSAKLVDPFQGVSVLCLNPRTFRGSEGSLKSNDLEAIHQHMTAMALQNPDKHFEEASSVLNGGLEFLSNKENEADLKENKNPREKRPALARKRAKFSMKPDTSQSHSIAEPSFQFDPSQGPEEFFAAYEKFENTVKELKRQRGEDVNEVRIPTTVRQRRPELPRRKVRYRHHIYSSQPENEVSFSQETLLDNIGSPPTRYSRQESANPDCQSKEEQVAGSVTKTEDRVNELFDQLMSSDINKLDLVKDRLKIKTVDINDLRLPGFHEIPKVDLVSSVNFLIRDQSILSDTHTSPDGLRGSTPVNNKTLSDNPLRPLASPKSPFLAISTFGKHLSKSVESNDPFSVHDIVSFLTTTKIIDEHSTHVSKDKESLGSGSLHPLVKNRAAETRVNENLSAEALIISPECHNMKERDVDDNGAGSYIVTDIQTNKDIQENVEQITTDIDIGDQHCIQVREDNVEDVSHKARSSTSREVNAEVSAIEHLNTHCSQSVETDANSVEDLNASRPDQNLDIVPEQPNEICFKRMQRSFEERFEKWMAENDAWRVKRAKQHEEIMALLRKLIQSRAALQPPTLLPSSTATLLPKTTQPPPPLPPDHPPSQPPPYHPPSQPLTAQPNPSPSPPINLPSQLPPQVNPPPKPSPALIPPTQPPQSFAFPSLSPPPLPSPNEPLLVLQPMLQTLNVQDAWREDLVRQLRRTLYRTEDTSRRGLQDKDHYIWDPGITLSQFIKPHLEDKEQEHLKTTLEKRERSRRGRKVELKKQRQSLAEAGTFYDAGVRRSNRIRRKPLEFWKGERLLYGRIHNSLPTVIGVKYLSSTNNGDPGFKVESFVDKKYKDLVEFAALH